ncbi:MAG: aromatic-ring-hydroxylating dioxygenase subunit beta [Bradyrhizobium sp.]
MSVAFRKTIDDAPDLEELRGFYDDYMETLDDGRLDDWPEFFVEDCLYRIIPRENFEAGYTLCTIQAESRGMLVDRVQGIQSTQMYAPRYYRRFYTGLRLKGEDATATRARQNVLVVQTMLNKPSQIVLCGVSHDVIVRDAGGLRFKERILVFDSEMIPNSLIYPA